MLTLTRNSRNRATVPLCFYRFVFTIRVYNQHNCHSDAALYLHVWQQRCSVCPASVVYLLSGGHHTEFDHPVLQLLFSQYGHQGDPRLLAVLQLTQQFGVLLVHHLCLDTHIHTHARAHTQTDHHIRCALISSLVIRYIIWVTIERFG